MKFVQFTVGSKNGPQKLGVLSAENDCVTEIAAKLPQDLIGLIKSGISLERLAQPDAKGKSYNVKDVKLLAPVSNPQKILCIGLNYRGHCEEQNKPVPKEPMFFSKYASAIVGPYDDVIAHGITEVSSNYHCHGQVWWYRFVCCFHAANRLGSGTSGHHR